MRSQSLFARVFRKFVAFGFALYAGSTYADNVAAAKDRPTAPNSGQNSGQEAPLEEIIVTATRRSEPLQEVPISVTAISGEALAASGIREARDLTQMVPGLNFQQAQMSAQPVIRGITTTNLGVADEANVGLYLDGIYQPDALANNFDLLKLDRVEVLRGPQGTIFGRNSTGGLINFITPDPSFTPAGEFGVGLGSFHARQLKGYVTGPVADNLAVNLSAGYYKDDGYFTDIVSNQRTGERETKQLRGKIKFAPNDLGSLVLTLNYSDVTDFSLNASQPYLNNTAGRTFPGVVLTTQPYQIALGVENPYHAKQVGAALLGRYDIGFASLESVTAYQHDETLQVRDSDSTIAPLQFARFPADSRYGQQELRLISSDSGPFTWLAGLYGLWGKIESHLRLSRSATTSPFFIQDTYNTTAAGAAFSEMKYSFTDVLMLTAGLRYSWEKKSIDQHIGNVALYTDSATFSSWTPRLALNYQYAPKLLLFASYSTGFKSGTFNISTSTPDLVQPETLAAYEIGFKSDPTPSLRINGSMFFYDYKDAQVAAILSTGPLLQNAASARPRGGELEINYRVTQDLQMNLAASVVDAKYKSFQNATVTIPLAAGGNRSAAQDVSGNYMARTPPYTLSVGANFKHAFEGGTLGTNVNLFHSGKVYFDFANRLYQSPRTAVNADITWTFNNRFRVRLWGKNLTDKVYAQYIATSGLADQIYYGRPREFGAGLEWSF